MLRNKILWIRDTENDARTLSLRLDQRLAREVVERERGGRRSKSEVRRLVREEGSSQASKLVVYGKRIRWDVSISAVLLWVECLAEGS